MSTQTKINAMAVSMGIHHIVRTIDGRQVPYRRVACDSCGAIEEVRHKPNAPPSQVRQQFEAKGWRFGKRLTCPSCSKPERVQKPAVVIPVTKPTEETTVKSNKPTVAPLAIDKARPAKPREVIRIADKLDEVFAEGRFKPGWTDRRIGEELDIPAATVAKTREELGLVLKENPEITALRADIADAREIIDDLSARLERLVAA